MGFHTAILLWRALNYLFLVFGAQPVAIKDVLDVTKEVDPRVLLTPLALHTYLKPFERLSFLLQNTDHIHAGTSRQRVEQQLHRTDAFAASTSVRRNVHHQGMPA